MTKRQLASDAVNGVHGKGEAMRDAQRQLARSPLLNGSWPPIAVTGANASISTIHDQAGTIDAESLRPPNPVVGHQVPAAVMISSPTTDLCLDHVGSARAVKILFERARSSVALDDRENVSVVRAAMLEAAVLAGFDPNSKIGSFNPPALREKIRRAPPSAPSLPQPQIVVGKRGATSTSEPKQAVLKRVKQSAESDCEPAVAKEGSLPSPSINAALAADLRPLNDDEIIGTDNVFKTGAHNIVLIDGRSDAVGGFVPLSRGTLLCLRKDVWLNDEVANRYLVSPQLHGTN